MVFLCSLHQSREKTLGFSKLFSMVFLMYRINKTKPT